MKLFKHFQKHKSFWFAILIFGFFFLELVFLTTNIVFLILNKFKNFKIIFITFEWFILGLCILQILALILYIFNSIKKNNNDNEKKKDYHFLSHNLIESFGKVGYIFFDKDGTITYLNSYAENFLGNKIIGHPLSSLVPNFSTIKQKDKHFIFSYKNHTLKMKFIHGANLLIFNDITEYNNLLETYENELMAIGIIQLDNYNESLSYLTDQQKNELIKLINVPLYAWADNNNVFLLKISNNQFMFITTRNFILNMLEQNNLKSLIQQINSVINKNNLSINIGIGLSYGLNNATLLFQHSLDNLKLSSTRGSNQVVLTDYLQSQNFIISEKKGLIENNIISLKNFYSVFRGKIEAVDEIIICGHRTPDYDCIGSGLGLIYLLNLMNKKIKFIYNPNHDDKELIFAFKKYIPDDFQKKYFFTIEEIQNSSIKPKTLLLIIDTSNISLLESEWLVKNINNIYIIDHHRAFESIDSKINFYINPYISSTCEIITHAINFYFETKFNAKSVPSFVSLFLYSGIMIDTNNFSKSTNHETFMAASLLKNWGVKQNEINDLRRMNNYSYNKIQILKNNFKEKLKGIFIAINNDSNIIFQQHQLSVAAEECLYNRSCKVAITIGYISKNIVSASLRSYSDYNVQLLAEKFNGGGHYNSAGIQQANTTPENLLNKLLKAISKKIN